MGRPLQHLGEYCSSRLGGVQVPSDSGVFRVSSPCTADHFEIKAMSHRPQLGLDISALLSTSRAGTSQDPVFLLILYSHNLPHTTSCLSCCW